MTHKPQGNKIEKRKNGGYEDVKEERIRRGIQSAGGQVRQKTWISKSSPEEALSIAKENQQLKKQIKALEKENRRLSEMNEFLEDTAAFFAASRQKSGKSSD